MRISDIILLMRFTKFVEVVLTVPSIEDTAAWYERILGWKAACDTFDEDGKCSFGSVSGAKDCYFNLARYTPRETPYAKDHPNVTFYINVDDVDATYRRVTANGWKVDHPPETQFWGGRTFTIRDLNGFYILFLQMIEHPSLEEIRRRSRGEKKESM